MKCTVMMWRSWVWVLVWSNLRHVVQYSSKDKLVVASYLLGFLIEEFPSGVKIFNFLLQILEHNVVWNEKLECCITIIIIHKGMRCYSNDHTWLPIAIFWVMIKFCEVNTATSKMWCRNLADDSAKWDWFQNSKT